MYPSDLFYLIVCQGYLVTVAIGCRHCCGSLEGRDKIVLCLLKRPADGLDAKLLDAASCGPEVSAEGMAVEAVLSGPVALAIA